LRKVIGNTSLRKRRVFTGRLSSVTITWVSESTNWADVARNSATLRRPFCPQTSGASKFTEFAAGRNSVTPSAPRLRRSVGAVGRGDERGCAGGSRQSDAREAPDRCGHVASSDVGWCVSVREGPNRRLSTRPDGRLRSWAAITARSNDMNNGRQRRPRAAPGKAAGASDAGHCWLRALRA
jgi:hypothetical protein